MPSLGTLLVNIVASSLGVGYFVYGKRQHRLTFLVAGIGLCVFPLLLDGVPAEILISVLLAAAPFAIRD